MEPRVRVVIQLSSLTSKLGPVQPSMSCYRGRARFPWTIPLELTDAQTGRSQLTCLYIPHRGLRASSGNLTRFLAGRNVASVFSVFLFELSRSLEGQGKVPTHAGGPRGWTEPGI